MTYCKLRSSSCIRLATKRVFYDAAADGAAATALTGPIPDTVEMKHVTALNNPHRPIVNDVMVGAEDVTGANLTIIFDLRFTPAPLSWHLPLCCVYGRLASTTLSAVSR